MRIFLIGFPGSGKSVLGRQLAQRLKSAFFDLDNLIEKHLGSSIPEIFKNNGERFFRETEANVLRKIIESHQKFVLATGGGTPCFEENINLMLKAGCSIYLEVSYEEIGRRLQQSSSDRPLLKGFTSGSFADQFKLRFGYRERYYRKADVVVTGDSISTDDIILALIAGGNLEKHPHR